MKLILKKQQKRFAFPVKVITIACLSFALTACVLQPDPMSDSERYKIAQQDVKNLFAKQSTLTVPLSLDQALARAMKYNLDYRIKLVDSALEMSQLDLARFALLPELNAKGSYYNRNNDYSTDTINQATGQPDSNFSTSTPRELTSGSTDITWNVLDFGLSYVKGKQQADKVLIAREEARKQMQQLAQDVRVAYWRAYSAQELMREVNEFQPILNQAEQLSISASKDTALPQEKLLRFQGLLLESDRRFTELKIKLIKSKLDLARLINLPLDQQFTLLAPPKSITNVQSLGKLDFAKLDALTLVNRPELRGQDYMERIAKQGIKSVVLEALPGISLSAGYNYDSNKYLENPNWLDSSADVSWNLLKLVSLPTAIKSAKTQVEYENLKRLALTMTALTEVRYAVMQYDNLHQEYLIVNEQAANAENLYSLLEHRQQASLEGSQAVVLAGLQALNTKMDRAILLSDLSTAMGQLYISVGMDTLTPEILNLPLDESTKLLQKSFAQQNVLNFKGYINASYEKLFEETTAKK